MAPVTRQQILDELRSYTKVSEKVYQLLTALNYRRETSLKVRDGTWEIYTKTDFVFPYFNTVSSTPVNKFVAVFRGKRDFVLYGSFELLIYLEDTLKKFTEVFLNPPQRFLGIPLMLTTENAQDYGYSRGLTVGLLLMGLDLSYAWVFKLKSGILTGFIDFIKLVYEGNVGLAIGVGIAGSGFYFGFLLIFLPLLYGNICVARAQKLEKTRAETMDREFFEFEYGAETEKSLEEEFNVILEEKRKKQIYGEAEGLWPGLDKERFELLYQQLTAGFFSPERLHELLLNIRNSDPVIDLEVLLDLIIRFRQATPQLEITLSPK